MGRKAKGPVVKAHIRIGVKLRNKKSGIVAEVHGRKGKIADYDDYCVMIRYRMPSGEYKGKWRYTVWNLDNISIVSLNNEEFKVGATVENTMSGGYGHIYKVPVSISRIGWLVKVRRKITSGVKKGKFDYPLWNLSHVQKVSK